MANVPEKRIINTEKKPTVFVSHNRDEVYRICEYVGIMSDGNMNKNELKRINKNMYK